MIRINGEYFKTGPDGSLVEIELPTQVDKIGADYCATLKSGGIFVVCALTIDHVMTYYGFPDVLTAIHHIILVINSDG